MSIFIIELKKETSVQDAGYIERLRTQNAQLKARVASLENRVASGDEESRNGWNAYQNSLAEVRQLKEHVRVLSQPDDYAKLERCYDELRDKMLELGSQNITLATQAEQAEQLESQLAIADQRAATT